METLTTLQIIILTEVLEHLRHSAMVYGERERLERGSEEYAGLITGCLGRISDSFASRASIPGDSFISEQEFEKMRANELAGNYIVRDNFVRIVAYAIEALESMYLSELDTYSLFYDGDGFPTPAE